MIESEICEMVTSWFYYKLSAYYYGLTRNLPGVARVKTLICKKANATNLLPSLMYNKWTNVGEHFREHFRLCNVELVRGMFVQ